MHDAGTGSGRCSVVVVKPVTVADAYRLRGALNGPESQSVFTGEVLTRLFGTMEQMHDVMMLLASGAQAAALAAALVSGFFAVAMRVRALALLRALGASHGFLAVSVWLMVSGVLLAGSALGLGLGCLMASAASSWIQAETGVALTVTLTAGDALAALAAAGCGCLRRFCPPGSPAAERPENCCARLSRSPGAKIRIGAFPEDSAGENGAGHAEPGPRKAAFRLRPPERGVREREKRRSSLHGARKRREGYRPRRTSAPFRSCGRSRRGMGHGRVGVRPTTGLVRPQKKGAFGPPFPFVLDCVAQGLTRARAFSPGTVAFCRSVFASRSGAF